MENCVVVNAHGKIERYDACQFLPTGSKIVAIVLDTAAVATSKDGNEYFKSSDIKFWTLSPAIFVFENVVTRELRLSQVGEQEVQQNEYPVGVVYSIDIMQNAQRAGIVQGRINSRSDIAHYLITHFPQLEQQIKEEYL